jgi:hypothetical protein
VNAGVVWCPGRRPLIGHFSGRILRDALHADASESAGYAGKVPGEGSACGTRPKRPLLRDMSSLSDPSLSFCLAAVVVSGAGWLVLDERARIRRAAGLNVVKVRQLPPGRGGGS